MIYILFLASLTYIPLIGKFAIIGYPLMFLLYKHCIKPTPGFGRLMKILLGIYMLATCTLVSLVHASPEIMGLMREYVMLIPFVIMAGLLIAHQRYRLGASGLKIFFQSLLSLYAGGVYISIIGALNFV